MSALGLLVVSALSAQLPIAPPPPKPAEAAEPVEEKKAPQVDLGPCGTPRSVVATWLDHLQAGKVDLDKASTCTLVTDKFNAQAIQKRLVKLKKVLDASGVYVLYNTIPDEPDYRDPKTARHEVEVTGVVPEIRVVRANNGWVVAPSTIEAADELYRETFPLDLSRIVDSLPVWTKQKLLGFTAWQAAFLGLLVLLGWILRLIVSWVLANQLRRLMNRLNITWGEKLVTQASLPLGNLALAGLLGLGVPSLQLGVKTAAITLLAVRTLAAFSFVMLLYRALDLLGVYFQSRADKTDSKLDDQLVPIAVKTLKFTTMVIGIIFVLQNLDIDVTSLITGLGLGGLAFALAAKDMVGNIFGSVMIFLDKPFQIGDWVVTSGVEGVVEEVGIRSTRIRTFYNSLVTVPNGKFAEAIVDNYGLREYRRCSLRLSVTYATTPEQMEAFCDGIRAIIATHPATRKDYYEVHFAAWGDSGLEVMLYFFFEVPGWSEELRARHEVYLDVWRLAGDLGIEFAFPTRTLHIDSQAAPNPMPEHVPPAKDELKRVVDGFGPGGDRVVPPGQRVHPGFYAGSSARGSESG